MISKSDRVKFLKKHHLFFGLSDPELDRVADVLRQKSVDQNSVISDQDTRMVGFYIIYRGRVRISGFSELSDQQYVVLSTRDYFGEIPISPYKPRSKAVEAIEDSLLFWFPPPTLMDLITNIPSFKANLKIFISSQRLMRRLRIRWLRSDEIIYFATHKHPYLLIQSLIVPAIIFGVSLITILVSLQVISASIITLFAGIIIIADILWGLWLYVDWGNDYYIITSQRVVWLEKIIFVRDSRQESPIGAILSVDVKSEYIGRELGFGDVVVRTFVGQIALLNVNHAYQAGQILDELLSRFKEGQERTEKETTKQLLRERLGLPLLSRIEISSGSTQTTVAAMKRPRPWESLIKQTEWFKSRIEKHGTVTYRKHWIVLFRQTLKPGLFLLLNVLVVLYGFNVLIWSPGQTEIFPLLFTLFSTLLLIPLMFWWLYEYIDWGNDIFQITSSQVIDIDRTFLGSEQRRSAPLGSIQSTEARRIGLFGQIFNYGTVYISVGNMQLTFDEVYDPVSVQQEIDSRRLARINDENKTQAEAERERIVDWLVTYHNNAEEFREQQVQNKKNPTEGAL